MADKAPTTAPGVLQVELNYLINTEAVKNILHVYRGSATHWEDSEIDDIAAAVQTWAENTWMPLLDIGCAFTGKTLTDLTDLDGIRKIYGETNPIEGTISGEYLPLNATFALRLTCQNRGRGVNGHLYIPVLAESQVTENLVHSATADSWVAALETLRTAIPGAVVGADLCILSKKLNGVWRDVGVARVVKSISYCDLIVDSQRTRLPAHRKHKKSTSTPTP